MLYVWPITSRSLFCLPGRCWPCDCPTHLAKQNCCLSVLFKHRHVGGPTCLQPTYLLCYAKLSSCWLQFWWQKLECFLFFSSTVNVSKHLRHWHEIRQKKLEEQTDWENLDVSPKAPQTSWFGPVSWTLLNNSLFVALSDKVLISRCSTKMLHF